MMSRNWVLAILCLVLSAGGGLAQDFGFDDNFSENPIDAGEWVVNGDAGWVPPPADAPAGTCIDPNLPILDFLTQSYDCSVYSEDDLDAMGVDPEDFGGYMLITPAAGNLAGNAFRAEPDTYDSFKMTIVVELRNGSVGRPADGMVIVVVGTDDVPMETGTGGGGMGAPCVGVPDTAPMFAFEFDNWSCNTGDNNDENHLGFSYSPFGFPCTDAIPPDVFVPIDANVADFHNQQDYLAGPVDPNRYQMTVFAQNCGGSLVVATDVEALDFNGGVNLGRVFTHEIPDFEPFDGYLGVTASTGGAWQNHILHSATLEPLPEGFCLKPVADGQRTIDVPDLPQQVCGDYEPNSEALVTIAVSNLRASDDCCAAASRVVVSETPPAGWAISNISNGGTLNAGVITWDISGGELVDGLELTYNATAPGAADQVYAFSGSLSDGEGGIDVLLAGDSRMFPDAPFDDCGRIKCWNILGSISQGGGAAPAIPDIQRDYLTDGIETELDFVFEPGAEISPDFFGESAGTGIFLDAMNRNPNALDGTATVFKYVDNADGWINLNDDVFGGDPNNVMAYAQIYLQSDEERDVYIASDSDDSIQVIVNEQEVWVNSIPRGNDTPCPGGLIPNPRAQLRDVTPEPVTLFEGENRLIVKTFEGGGGFNFELRIEDELENPITDGISLSHFELNPTCRTPPAIVTRDIDTGREVGGDPAWSLANIGGTVGVTLSLSNTREAQGVCDDAGMVTITETVPAEWTPSNASNGGSITGNVIEWTLQASDGASVTYDISPDGAAQDVSFRGNVQEIGSALASGVKGDKDVVYAPAPFGREPGDAEELVATGFDGETGLCPDGFSCNFIGSGLFEATVVEVNTLAGTEERARLACAGDGALDPAICADRATNMIWNDPVDLSENSFTASFDVYLSHPGADLQAPADALTFFVIDADDPLTGSPNVIGGQGGSNGVAGLTGFAVELDLWANNADDPSGYNQAANAYTHIGVTQDGIVTPHNQTHLDILGPNAFPTALGGAGWPEMVDFGGTGVPIHIEVDYNNGNLQVWMEAPETNFGLEPAFPRTKVIDTVVTFANVGGLPVDPSDEPVLQNAYLGFSASTGGALITADVDNLEILLHPRSDAPVEICDNGSDDDGDGDVDCDDADCAGTPACPTGKPFIRADANTDGAINLSDPVSILNTLFLGIGQIVCDAAADANNDGAINLSDPVAILNTLFLGIGVIPPPATCEEKPDAEEGTCNSFPPCE